MLSQTTKNHLKTLFNYAVTVVSSVVIIVLGITFLSRATTVTTTIGENISTNDLIVYGNATTTGAHRVSGNLLVNGTTTFNGVAYTWPGADGTSGYALVTNGSGALSWSTVSSGSGTLNYGAAGSLVYYASSGTTATGTASALLNWDNINRRLGVATSSPYATLSVSGIGVFDDYIRASYFIATSTTATTTLAGGLNVGSGRLVSDFSSGNTWLGSGNLGLGTTSPYAKFSVSGNTALDSNVINFASSTAPSLTINYLKSATSTIPAVSNAWNIATSTTATPIFSINGALGKIGIGTVADQVAAGFDLHISRATGNASLRVDSLSGGGKISIAGWITEDLPSSAPIFTMGRHKCASGTNCSYTPLTTNDWIAVHVGVGQDDDDELATTDDMADAVNMIYIADGEWSTGADATDNPTAIMFRTTADGYDGFEASQVRMEIRQSGRILLYDSPDGGTNNTILSATPPEAKLTVRQSKDITSYASASLSNGTTQILGGIYNDIELTGASGSIGFTGLVSDTSLNFSSDPGTLTFTGNSTILSVPSGNSTAMSNAIFIGSGNSVKHAGSGGVSEIRSFDTSAILSGGATVPTVTVVQAGANFNAGSSITNLYYYKTGQAALGGTIANTYGYYVGDITGAGTQTNTPYSFYASDSGTYNYFAGNVGIGTTSPYAKLSVTGTAVITATTTIGVSSTAQQAGLQIGYGGICVDNDGTCTASTTGRVSAVEFVTAASDIAENYYSDETLTAGNIIITKGGSMVGKANKNSQNAVIGIVSTKPGIILGLENDNPTLDMPSSATGIYPVALAGRVPVKVNTEAGNISIGDPLNLSSEDGVAKKASEPGQIIGYALENYDGPTEENNGQIFIFINITYWFPPDYFANSNLDNIAQTAENSNAGIVEQGLEWILNQFKGMGIAIKNGVIEAKEFVAERIKVKEMEMTDSATGEVYCVRIYNGEWAKLKGFCGATDITPPANSDTAPVDSDTNENPPGPR